MLESVELVPFACTESGVWECLSNYRARWYDPAVGRFVSEDPSGFAGGDANLYRYAGNSPVIYVDPSGLSHDGIIGDAGVIIKEVLDSDLLKTALEVGLSLAPGIGEAMDVGVAIAPDSRPIERAIAVASLGLSVATLGMSPNFGTYVRAARRLGRGFGRADTVVDVARTAGRGADGLATAARSSRSPTRTAVDKVSTFLKDDSGTLRIPQGQSKAGLEAVGPVAGKTPAQVAVQARNAGFRPVRTYPGKNGSTATVYRHPTTLEEIHISPSGDLHAPIGSRGAGPHVNKKGPAGTHNRPRNDVNQPIHKTRPGATEEAHIPLRTSSGGPL